MIKKNYVILIVFISCFSSNIFVSSGTLDTSFNALGIQPGTASTTIDGFTIDNSGYSVAIQQDGKTVVAGYADIGGAYNFAVARFNTNGTLDTSFNSGGAQPGTASTTIDGFAIDNKGYSVAIQQDGKIVVAGTADIGGAYKLAVARFNIDGTLDISFNSGGAQPGTASTTIDGFAINNTGNSVAIQQDGKIVVAGTADIGGAYNFAVARFNTNGTLDTSFNAAGTQPGTASTTIDNSTYNIGTSVAIQEDGKIVVAGFALIGGTFKFAVARFNTNGTLDTSFNALGLQPGTVSTTIDGVAIDNEGNSVAIQQDGKIVVAGFALIGGTFKFAVARFNTNGTLDTSFNAAEIQPGTASTTIDGVATDNKGYSVAIQQDGKIVVAGEAFVGGAYKFAVARFNTNGTLDASFNAAEIQPGTASTTIDNSTDNNFGKSVAIQQDGKIVVAGDAFIDGVTKFAVARFNGDAIVAMIDPFALRLIEKYGPRL
ncbi:MAG: hypothetical protein WC747_00635 [Candidatus Babeliales bacterium]